jgi:excisionase family DNA binding protein
MARTEEQTTGELLRPRKAFELMDLPKSTGYALIASGEWPSVRIGRAIRIPRQALQKWLADKLRREANESAHP